MAQKIEIGIEAQDRVDVASALSRYVADLYALMVKTQGFHWNVTGPHFDSLHSLFGRQYDELSAAVDEVAERIRALGHPAPGSLAQFLRLTTLPEEEGLPAWNDMVHQLVEGHEAVARVALEMVDIADDVDDVVTEELMIGRMRAHHKAAWQLRSTLE